MQIPSFRAAALLALTLLFITGELAAAREVALPLRFDNALVEKILVDQLFTGPGQSLVAMKDGSGCNYLILSDPRLSGVDGLLRIRSGAKGRVATAIGSRCLVLLDWTGFVETDQRAELGVSGDGLRRMARMIAPAAAGDPLTRSQQVDPELRSLMGFGAAIAPPQRDGGAWWLDGILRQAHGRARIDPLLVVKLNLWVAHYKNAKGYLPLAEDLLEQAAEVTMGKGKVPAKHARLFHDLVLATAWKESCWRQFVRKRGQVTTIRSVTGALGMMQVDPNAWRGFYDIADLAENIGYNARAGADILAHYLTHYAIRKREDKYGIADALARATYAVYNGGPSHRRRYRLKKTKKSLRAIDKSFYEKYLSIKSGDSKAVMSCYLG